jgi:hypothetical protein
VDLTFAEIVASDIPRRTNDLAARIAAERPEVIGLQEVGLWRFGFTPETARFILYDQLELLLAALRRQGVPYRTAAVIDLTDIALPATVGALRLTDRDALLVRVDLPANDQVLNAQGHVFTAYFPFGEFNILSGWISADIVVDGKSFHFVTTHLMSSIPGIPATTDIQAAQTAELIANVGGFAGAVVLSGDWNSDANFGHGPDATPSVAMIESAGIADDWRAANPSDTGATWPLFLQDQKPPRFFAASEPFERIDVFFSKGISVLGQKRVVTTSPLTLPGYASDHAGIVATFGP